MTTNADRITKLATRLSTVEANKDKYTTQYNDIVKEISTILAGEAVTAVKSAMIAPKAKSGVLSARITKALSADPGQSVSDLSTRLRVEAKKIGLALYHLGKKEMVFEKGDQYFLAPNSTTLSMAAKSVPYTTPEDETDTDTE